MGNLSYHRELQKGLDTITRLSNLVNERQVELSALNEEIDHKTIIKASIELRQREFNQAKQEREDTLSRLQDDIRGARVAKDIAMSALNKLELKRIIKDGEFAAANNSAFEMVQIKTHAKAEMNLYERLKAEKLAEFNSVQCALSTIHADMRKEVTKLDEIALKVSQEQRTIEQKWRELDAKESGLVVRDKYLNMLEKRLMKYAETLNINL